MLDRPHWLVAVCMARGGGAGRMAREGGALVLGHAGAVTAGAVLLLLLLPTEHPGADEAGRAVWHLRMEGLIGMAGRCMMSLMWCALLAGRGTW
jgi:hypothetical protein